MAAPLYTQDEVEWALGVRKVASLSEVTRSDESGNQLPEKRFRRSRSGSPHFEKRTTILACPDEPRARFEMEEARNSLANEIWITLHLKLGSKPSSPMCRYDIQTGGHRNPDWFSPSFVPSQVPHRHIYNVRAIEQFARWDKCAEILDLDLVGTSIERDHRSLRGRFVRDLNIHFEDSETANQLFQHGL